MITPFRKLPIRTRLVIMVMTVSCVAVVLVAIIHSLVRVHESRRDMASKLSSMAAVVAFNSRAAVAFNDVEAANRVVEAFQFEPAILFAELCDAQGRPLARFVRQAPHRSVPDRLGSEQAWGKPRGMEAQQRFRGHHLSYYQPIIVNGEQIGRLFIESELSFLRQRYLVIALVSAGSLLLAALLTYLLTLRLQRWISEPLQRLTVAMGEVAGNQTLDLDRAGETFDEIKLLQDGFDSMVARIGVHEKELFEANEILEYRVEQRTGELLQANQSLTAEINRRMLIENQQRGLLAEKELLLKEVHHRVKNNLQVISSLINMQMRKMEDSAGRDELFSVRERIRSMSLIHQQLCRSGDLGCLPFNQFAHEFIHELSAVYGIKERSIRLSEELAPVVLNVEQAIPCGMILSELLSNSFKHAFSEDAGGQVGVLLQNDNDMVRLKVTDSGRGYVADVKQSLGLKLVHNLVEQLRGEMTFTVTDGLSSEVVFPLKTPGVAAELENIFSQEKKEG